MTTRSARYQREKSMPQPTAKEYGRQHHAEGIPRRSNPFYAAAFANGARKPESHHAVKEWWAGWDEAEKERSGK